MKQTDPHSQTPIVIVRRKPLEDEPHHGGAWKIAYADFVTSLMAFFLVMWLVNVTDDKTKAAIVTYFNPINLVNDSDGIKGLSESDYSHHAFAKKQGNKTFPTRSQAIESDKSARDKQVAHDPYKLLDEIMSNPGPRGKVTSEPPVHDSFGFINASNDIGVNGSDSNPFAEKDLENVEFAKKGPNDIVQHARDHNAVYVEVKPIKQVKTLEDEKNKEANRLMVAKEAAKISQQLDKAVQLLAKDKQAPKIELVQEDNGILINLLDKKNFGMFDVGVAKPRRETIVLLEQISKVLQAQKGQLIISGHTDARPYHSDNYDNWQLSTARAQMVYYMLTRGGLSKDRVEKIVGYADKDLKNKKDPYAAENRYIGLFLKVEPIKSKTIATSSN